MPKTNAVMSMDHAHLFIEMYARKSKVIPVLN
jgi:hypothetical protein